MINKGFGDDDEDDDNDSYSDDDDDGDDYVTNLVDDDDMDAKEMLPFSAIHHVVPMDGLGFACDYGNFIKVICLDNKKLAALRRQQQQSMFADQPMFATNNLYLMETGSDGSNNTGATTNDLPLPSSSSSSPMKNNPSSHHRCTDHGMAGDASCQCKKDGSKCCGGKQLNNGVCCGGVGKSTKGHLLSSSTSSSVAAKSNTSGGGASYEPTPSSCQVRPSVAECPAKATCSRAADCHIVHSSKSSWI
ncbi:unnamed protein product [Absidia cylindrospora]